MKALIVLLFAKIQVKVTNGLERSKGISRHEVHPPKLVKLDYQQDDTKRRHTLHWSSFLGLEQLFSSPLGNPKKQMHGFCPDKPEMNQTCQS